MEKSNLILLLMTSVAVFITPAFAQDDLAKREAELLAQVKATKFPEPVVRLAEVREQRGRYKEAIATWGLVKKNWGQRNVPHQSSAPDRTYGDMADFIIQRLCRKQNHAATPPRVNTQVQRQTSRWLSDHRFFALQKGGNYDFLVQEDLDGDYIDEVFFVGKYGPLGKRNEPFMGIAKWNGSRYQVVYRAEGKNKPIIMPVGYDMRDQNGDGWKEIFLTFEPETENGSILYFNGTAAKML